MVRPREAGQLWRLTHPDFHTLPLLTPPVMTAVEEAHVCSSAWSCRIGAQHPPGWIREPEGAAQQPTILWRIHARGRGSGESTSPSVKYDSPLALGLVTAAPPSAS